MKSERETSNSFLFTESTKAKRISRMTHNHRLTQFSNRTSICALIWLSMTRKSPWVENRPRKLIMSRCCLRRLLMPTRGWIQRFKISWLNAMIENLKSDRRPWWTRNLDSKMSLASLQGRLWIKIPSWVKFSAKIANCLKSIKVLMFLKKSKASWTLQPLRHQNEPNWSPPPPTTKKPSPKS